jgi:hypothetical protein
VARSRCWRSTPTCDDVVVDARLLLDDPVGAAWLVRTALAADDRARAELVVAQAERLAVLNAAERTYLSRHTVDFNLRQIFRKLGIQSRVALARLYFERRSRTDAKDHASV